MIGITHHSSRKAANSRAYRPQTRWRFAQATVCARSRIPCSSGELQRAGYRVSCFCITSRIAFVFLRESLSCYFVPSSLLQTLQME
jgi:hypothetical protein